MPINASVPQASASASLPRRNPGTRYGIALLCLGVALSLRAFLTPVWGVKFPFIVLYPTVLVSTWYGGAGPGLLTTALGMIVALVWWTVPVGSLRLMDPADWVGASVSLGVNLLIVSLTDSRQRTVRQLTEQTAILEHTTATLRASEARLRRLVDANMIGVVFWHVAGPIVDANDAYLQMLGYEREDVTAHRLNWRVLSVPEELPLDEAAFAEMRRKGACTPYEKVNLHKNGRRVPVLLGGSFFEESETEGVSFALDLTPLKAAQADRDRLLAELQQFVYIVSHDLTEPLRTIHSFVKLLAQRTAGQLDTEAAEDMAFITDATQRMQQMLTGLLTYTRAGYVPQFTAVDCEVVLTEVLAALHTRIAECGAVITHDPLPIVWGDATRIGQVFQNLLENALKFCETQPPRVHMAVAREEQHWRFAVQDNGIGVDPQHADRIFQIFQRLHPHSSYPGTGMGLAICKRIIEQHGGRIWVESEPSKGACFFFTLPAEQGEPYTRS